MSVAARGPAFDGASLGQLAEHLFRFCLNPSNALEPRATTCLSPETVKEMLHCDTSPGGRGLFNPG